jgi:hypothetical protein
MTDTRAGDGDGGNDLHPRSEEKHQHWCEAISISTLRRR